MKLVIKESCVVKNGRIAERGSVYNTGDVEAKEDREAYQLISTGRALKAGTPEADELLNSVSAEKKDEDAPETKKNKK